MTRPGVQSEQGEQSPSPDAAQSQRAAIVLDPKRAEDTEPQHASDGSARREFDAPVERRVD
jgi:hypothetical protein